MTVRFSEGSSEGVLITMCGALVLYARKASIHATR
jgi:hypothetical protein